MRNTTHRALASLAWALLATAAQAGDARAADTSATASPETPVAPPLNSAGEGRRQYLELNCYSCHGMRAQGGMGPNIVHAEAGDVREAVWQGEDSGMISFKHYANKVDLKNLAAYLKSIGTAKEPRFNDWWLPNPAR